METREVLYPIFSALCILASMGLSLAGCVRVFLHRRSGRMARRLLDATLFLMGSVAALQLGFAFAGARDFLPFTFFADVMQAFSMDVGYDEVFTSAGSISSVFWVDLAVAVHAMFIYTAAPVAGGAMILDVLAGVSPALLMALYRRRELYIFSALNERSVLLAESIAGQPDQGRDRAFVFAGADSGEETELYLRARALPYAVCLRDDMLHCAGFRRSPRCRFFLMDTTENGGFDDGQNLAALHGLLTTERDAAGRYAPVLWASEAGCVVYFFTDSAGTVENVRSLKKIFYARREASSGPAAPFGEVELYVFRDLACAALSLMEKRPLFLPLGRTPPAVPTPLRVVLFGDSPFAREMFKTVFWCGQMLNVQLYITVVCRRTGAAGQRPAFLRWLDRLSPEIAASCERSDGGQGPECLRVWPGEDAFAPPYARLSFIETEDEPDLRALLTQPCQRMHDGTTESFRLADCDYFLVMEDADLDNIALADSIRSSLIRLRLQSGADGRSRRQTVCFAVGSDSLQQVARERFAVSRDLRLPPASVSVPDMYPFGSLRERFSWENVSQDETQYRLSRPDRRRNRNDHPFANADEPGDPLYDDWSTAARRTHLLYKIFCAGCLQADPEPEPPSAPEQTPCRQRLRGDAGRRARRLYDVLFDAPPHRQALRREAMLRQERERLKEQDPRRIRQLLRYYRAVSGADGDHLADRLTWLEHRRWCAFLRVNGFTRPFASIDEVTRCLPEIAGVLRAGTNRQALDAIRASCREKGLEPGALCVPPIYGSKDVPYRLHPCLVEASPDMMRRDDGRFDALDVITAARIYDQLKPALADPARLKDPDGDRRELKKYDRPIRCLRQINKDKARETIPESDPLYAWIDRYPEDD